MFKFLFENYLTRGFWGDEAWTAGISRLPIKEIIAITVVQIHQYCGNVLQLGSKEGKSMIVMSKTAHNAFTQENRNTLSKYGELIIADIPTIEQVGGGSARCMMAEVFK